MLRRFTLGKLLVVVVVVFALAIGTAKGVMYWRVKDALDHYILENAHLVQIEYGSISTELRGAASVDDVRVRPIGSDEQAPARIDRVRFSTADPLPLMLGFDLQEDGPPPEFNLDVYGVHLPLDFYQSSFGVDSALSATPEGAQAFCEGFNVGSDPQALQVLGFEELSLDLGWHYRFDTLRKRLNVDMTVELMNIQSMRTAIELEGLAIEDIRDEKFNTVRLAGMDLAVKSDPGFGKRATQLCADATGLSLTEFQAQAHAQMLQQLADLGIELGPGLNQALADYSREWGELHLKLQPPSPLSLVDVVSLDEGNLLSALGVSLSLNDRPIGDLSAQFLPQLVSAIAQPPTDPPLGARIPPKRVYLVRRFRDVPVNSLRLHIDRVVRVQPQDQPVREGVLVAVQKGEAQIEQRLFGGAVTAYVPLEQIRTAEVEVVERQDARPE